MHQHYNPSKKNKGFNQLYGIDERAIMGRNFSLTAHMEDPAVVAGLKDAQEESGVGISGLRDVYRAIVRTNSKSCYTKISQWKLAEKLGISVNTVFRAIRALRRASLLWVTHNNKRTPEGNRRCVSTMTAILVRAWIIRTASYIRAAANGRNIEKARKASHRAKSQPTSQGSQLFISSNICPETGEISEKTRLNLLFAESSGRLPA